MAFQPITSALLRANKDLTHLAVFAVTLAASASSLTTTYVVVGTINNTKVKLK